MRYNIRFACVSHVGRIRSMNQDNFICDGLCLQTYEQPFPLCGVKSSRNALLFGVFDGMGGEECGEVASFIAAKTASEIKGDKIDLLHFCKKANAEICDYAGENGITTMGTTAAMLAFTDNGIEACNIGDSKVFRLRNGRLAQISKDHVAVAAFGVKPPLSQYLGIEASEMIIEPYLCSCIYKKGDCYLICSDGVTDMLNNDEIASLLKGADLKVNAEKLLEKSLVNGGKDNITFILLCIEKVKRKWFQFRKNGGKT